MSRRSKPFDAFISYAHEQQDVAIWLHRLLERYWVPGRRGRTVFLDREHLSAGVLDPTIRDALDHSRCLIVLCSVDAKNSKWVDLEIEHFVARHGSAQVYGARVGNVDGRDVPESINYHRALAGKLVPHLYGAVSSWGRDTARAREQTALALLAAILGVDKASITARRQRLRLLSAYAVAFLSATIALWSGWLYGSADGSFYQARQLLEADAKAQRADDPALVRAAYAAGRIGAVSLVETLAKSAAEPSSAAQLRLAGAAGEGTGCDELRRLHSRIDPSANRAWPDASLLAGRHCPITVPELSASTKLQALLAAGRFDEAVPMLANDDVDVVERLQAAVLLTALGVMPDQPAPDAASMLIDLLASEHPTDRAAALDEVVVHYWAVKPKPSAHMAKLLQAAASGLLAMNAHAEVEWLALNRTAALATLNAQPELARALREISASSDTEMAKPPHCHAIGLAWAALADARHDPTRSALRLVEAKACGGAEAPVSKNWLEWHDIARALYASDRWREAWALPSQIPDARARMRLTAELLDRYVERRCQQRSLIWKPWPVLVSECKVVDVKPEAGGVED